MKFFKRKPTEVCQNCKNGNNLKGKWISTWKRRNIDERGFWHVFCERSGKYYPWDYRKRCYEKCSVVIIKKRDLNDGKL